MYYSKFTKFWNVAMFLHLFGFFSSSSLFTRIPPIAVHFLIRLSFLHSLIVLLFLQMFWISLCYVQICFYRVLASLLNLVLWCVCVAYDSNLNSWTVCAEHTERAAIEESFENSIILRYPFPEHVKSFRNNLYVRKSFPIRLGLKFHPKKNKKIPNTQNKSKKEYRIMQHACKR